MKSREASLERLREPRPWDVVVIGGGATGLGTALESVTRGYETLLLEARDFASGTSSRSTKLVHGGVRYLAQGQVSLVREALRERGRLARNAPHLVRDLKFLVPAYTWIDRPYYGLGLWLYDRLAGSLGLGSSRLISRDEALTLTPTLEPAGLRGGVVYHDGQFDDARLAITLAQTIDDFGGTALNWMEVVGFTKSNDGMIEGLTARDVETGENLVMSARVVINATGVFADEVRHLDDPSTPPMIRPSQGAHLVLPREFLPGETAIMVPKTDDGRVLFAIPWNDRVIIGTTDTPVPTIEREPRPLREELRFLFTHASRYLVRDPRPDDVRSVYAGLRPLIGSSRGSSTRTSKISREYAAAVSRSGLVTITGGKWTTYRSMGESAIDLATRVGRLTAAPSVTADLKLHGWSDTTLDPSWNVYGTDASDVLRIQDTAPEAAERIDAELPYRESEVVWAARFEAARTVEDVLSRRTRALLLDARASMRAAPRVAGVLARELGRSDAWIGEQVESYKRLATGYLPPHDL